MISIKGDIMYHIKENIIVEKLYLINYFLKSITNRKNKNTFYNFVSILMLRC